MESDPMVIPQEVAELESSVLSYRQQFRSGIVKYTSIVNDPALSQSEIIIRRTVYFDDNHARMDSTSTGASSLIKGKAEDTHHVAAKVTVHTLKIGLPGGGVFCEILPHGDHARNDCSSAA